MCEVTGTTPQCNANPKVTSSTDKKSFTYVPVNVCRTVPVQGGGANAVNCQSVPDGPAEQVINSRGNADCLNAKLMPKPQGVWRNYKMIGSLWVRGNTGPETPFTVQIFQSQSGTEEFGEPVGFRNLANTTMETWMQSGSTGYDYFGDNSYQAGCFNCHNLPSSTSGDDLSHYPGKLPRAALLTRLKELVPANSQMTIKPLTLPISAAMPVRNATLPAAHPAKKPTPH